MRIIFFILFIFLNSGEVASAEVNRPISFEIADNISYMVDAYGKLKLEEVLSAPDELWQHSDEKGINLGFRQEIFWFRMNLPACVQENKVLEIVYPLLDSIDLWFLARDGVQRHFEAGDTRAFHSRPMEALSFGFPYKCESVSSVVIKLKTNSAVQLPIRFWDESDFIRHNSYVENAQMLYFGALLVMILYNTFIYISVRNLSYLFYVLFALSYAMFQAGIVGVGFRYLWPNLPAINDHVIDKSLIGVVAFGLYFAIRFLKSQVSSPRAFKAGMGLIAILCVYSVVSFTLPYYISIKIVILAVVLGVCITILLIVSSLMQRMREGYFYGAAWLSFLLGAFALVFSKLGIIPDNALTENALQIASVMEMLLLSFALADQTNILRRNLATANTKLADTLQSIEHIVNEKTQSIRSIMGTMKQGIITVKSQDLIIEPEFSGYTTILLGQSQIDGHKLENIFIDHLELGSDQKQQIISVLSNCIDEDILNFEVNACHLPVELGLKNIKGSKEIAVDWTPIVNSKEQIERFLISFRDVTELNRLKLNQVEQAAVLVRLQQLLNADKKTLKNFFKRALVEVEKQCSMQAQEFSRPETLRKIFVSIHTLKGESRSVGLRDVSESCHVIENYLEEAKKLSDKANPEALLGRLHELRQVMNDYHELYQEKIGLSSSDDDLVLDLKTLEGWESRLHMLRGIRSEGEPLFTEILQDIYRLIYVDIKTYEKKIQSWAKSLALELDVLEPRIVFQGSVQYLNKDAVDLLDQCLVHLMQNSIAHAFESPDERIGKGKSPAGVISVGFVQEGDRVYIQVSDDGRGLNLAAIKKRVVESGRIKENEVLTKEIIETCIFAAGFSSAAQVSKIAGRGVGMDAIRQFVLNADGRIFLNIEEPKQNYASFIVVIDLSVKLFPDARTSFKSLAS